ncbi:hypothetical protein B566_EDAN013667 [Ephemera danica]|nr:hypothetical protein B566_EDAN013667 [Ephemera danica]
MSPESFSTPKARPLGSFSTPKHSMVVSQMFSTPVASSIPCTPQAAPLYKLAEQSVLAETSIEDSPLPLKVHWDYKPPSPDLFHSPVRSQPIKNPESQSSPILSRSRQNTNHVSSVSEKLIPNRTSPILGKSRKRSRRLGVEKQSIVDVSRPVSPILTRGKKKRKKAKKSKAIETSKLDFSLNLSDLKKEIESKQPSVCPEQPLINLEQPSTSKNRFTSKEQLSDATEQPLIDTKQPSTKIELYKAGNTLDDLEQQDLQYDQLDKDIADLVDSNWQQVSEATKSSRPAARAKQNMQQLVQNIIENSNRPNMLYKTVVSEGKVSRSELERSVLDLERAKLITTEKEPAKSTQNEPVVFSKLMEDEDSHDEGDLELLVHMLEADHKFSKLEKSKTTPIKSPSVCTPLAVSKLGGRTSTPMVKVDLPQCSETPIPKMDLHQIEEEEDTVLEPKKLFGEVDKNPTAIKLSPILEDTEMEKLLTEIGFSTGRIVKPSKSALKKARVMFEDVAATSVLEDTNPDSFATESRVEVESCSIDEEMLEQVEKLEESAIKSLNRVKHENKTKENSDFDNSDMDHLLVDFCETAESALKSVKPKTLGTGKSSSIGSITKSSSIGSIAKSSSIGSIAKSSSIGSISKSASIGSTAKSSSIGSIAKSTPLSTKTRAPGLNLTHPRAPGLSTSHKMPALKLATPGLSHARTPGLNTSFKPTTSGFHKSTGKAPAKSTTPGLSKQNPPLKKSPNKRKADGNLEVVPKHATIEVSGFKTAGGSDVKVSEKSLEAAKSLFEDLQNEEIHPDHLILTDSWYPIRTKIDDEMKRLIGEGKIVEGTKLMIHGAELEGSECLPLQQSEEMCLKISTNSTRRARWWTKLQFYPGGPMKIDLGSVLPYGGSVGAVECVVTKVYPMVFAEKTVDGRTVMRGERAEKLEASRAEEARQKLLEKIVAEERVRIKQEQDREAVQRRKSTCSEGRDDGEWLYMALQADPDLQSSLTESQCALALEWSRDERDRWSACLDKRVRERASSECPARTVSPLLKVRLSPVDSVQLSAVLSIWRPDLELSECLRESTVVRVFGAVASGKRCGDLCLNSVKSTKILPSSCLADTWVRHVTPIGSLDEPSFKPQFNEVDLVGIVTKIEPMQCNNMQCVILCDSIGYQVVVCFWGGIESHGLSQLFIPGVSIAASNLQWRKGSKRQLSVTYSSLPSLHASETSSFSREPTESYLQEALQKLRATLDPEMTMKNLKKCLTPATQKPTAVVVEKPQSQEVRKRLSALAKYGEPPPLSPLLCTTPSRLCQSFNPPSRVSQEHSPPLSLSQ